MNGKVEARPPCIGLAHAGPVGCGFRGSCSASCSTSAPSEPSPSVRVDQGTKIRLQRSSFAWAENLVDGFAEGGGVGVGSDPHQIVPGHTGERGPVNPLFQRLRRIAQTSLKAEAGDTISAGEAGLASAIAGFLLSLTLIVELTSCWLCVALHVVVRGPVGAVATPMPCIRIAAAPVLCHDGLPPDGITSTAVPDALTLAAAGLGAQAQTAGCQCGAPVCFWPHAAIGSTHHGTDRG